MLDFNFIFKRSIQRAICDVFIIQIKYINLSYVMLCNNNFQTEYIFDFAKWFCALTHAFWHVLHRLFAHIAPTTSLDGTASLVSSTIQTQTSCSAHVDITNTCMQVCVYMSERTVAHARAPHDCFVFAILTNQFAARPPQYFGHINSINLKFYDFIKQCHQSKPQTNWHDKCVLCSCS